MSEPSNVEKIAAVAGAASSDSQYVKDKGFLPGDLPVEEYARLQGAEEIGARLIEHKASKAFAVHVLGNGVPIPMGRYIARSARTANDPSSATADARRELQTKTRTAVR